MEAREWMSGDRDCEVLNWFLGGPLLSPPLPLINIKKIVNSGFVLTEVIFV